MWLSVSGPFLYLFSSKNTIFHKFLYRTFWYSRNYTYFYFPKWRYKPRMVLKINNLHILRYLPTCWLYLLECYTIDNQRCTHTASENDRNFYHVNSNTKRIQLMRNNTRYTNGLGSVWKIELFCTSCIWFVVFCCYFVARIVEATKSNKFMAQSKEPIRLRKRKTPTGLYSLYLDIYLNGQRSYENLKLYLIPETSCMAFPVIKRINIFSFTFEGTNMCTWVVNLTSLCDTRNIIPLNERKHSSMAILNFSMIWSIV